MAERKPEPFEGAFFSSPPNDFASDIIMQVKACLMYGDSTSQISAITWIKNALTVASDKEREYLVEVLIASDVAYVLCEVLSSSNSETFTLILDIVDNLASSVKFYTHTLAKKAVHSIFRIAYFMMKTPEKHAETLSTVTHMICVILRRGITFDYPISRICDASTIILFLKGLKPSNSSKYVLHQHAADLLCFVMKRIDLSCSKNTRSDLLAVLRDSLLSASAVIDEHKNPDDPSRYHFIQIICSVCFAGIRLCNDDVLETAPPADEIGWSAFAKAISKAMVETVIPIFPTISFKREDLIENVSAIVTCCEHLMQLKCCNTNELTNSLVTNGYLRFLLAVPPSIRLRDLMSSLISEVITNLSRDRLPTENAMTSRIEFRNDIYSGIVALPTEITDFDLALVHDGIVSDVLTILMYYNYRGTGDDSLFSLSTIIPRMRFLTEDTPIVVLTSVWLLFAVSSLKDSEAQLVNFCNPAVEHLAHLLANNDVENCYTHHPAIIEHGLVCEGFPIELKYEIIRLWLDFDGDTKTLLKTDKLELITDCLVSIMETSSDKLVARAQECINELKSDKRCRDRIDAIIWEASRRVLARFSIIGTIANIKSILQLFEKTKLENHDKIVEVPAVPLMNIMMKQDVDEEFKILLVKHVHKLLDVSSASNNTKVVKICLNDPELARTLRDEGFSRNNYRLPTACSDLLAFIVECQVKFKLECNDLAIAKVEPMKMLDLLARSTHAFFSAAMRLLLVLLDLENVIAVPIVSLNDFEDEGAAEQVVGAWYRQLRLLHTKVPTGDWDLVFRCLTAVLHFCHRKKFAKLMSNLCDHSGNYFLVSRTIMREYFSAVFIDFVGTWIHYSNEYRTPNRWVQSVSAAAAETIEKSLGPTQFDKTMAMLKEFGLKESY